MKNIFRIVSLILILIIFSSALACKKYEYSYDYTSTALSEYSEVESSIQDITSSAESNVSIESISSVESQIISSTVSKVPVSSTSKVQSSNVVSSKPVTAPVINNSNGRKPLNYDFVKGIWLYQYSGTSLFREKGDQRNEKDYRKLVTQICNNLRRDGYNTLFLQVRGHGDSFYPSKLFPPSRYVVADYDSKFKYDPLKIFIEIAHKYKISIHAWINPYRLLLTDQIPHVPDNYKIKQWYNKNEGDYIVAIAKRYFANPAYKEVQQLIIDGAVELCKNYNIDGLHIDDYFYNEKAKSDFDLKSYNELSNGRSLKEFRRDNVNDLVKALYKAVHNVNPDLQFGISPSGNMSLNRGYLSADIDTWCTTSGYIDYIAPQVYWSHEHIDDLAKFDICAKDWGNLITCNDVKLIVGMGLYRIENPNNSNSSDPAWFNNKDNIKRQLEFIYNYEKAGGFVMFDYESLYDIFTGEYTANSLEERKNFLPLVKKAIKK